MNSVNIKLYNFGGNNVEEKKFDISNLDAINQYNIASIVNWQRAKSRSGNSNVKDMSEISGTTAKPHKQKGTGRARQGSKRSVQFVGGRTCHGPKTRSFEYTANKKAKEKSKIDCLKVKLSSGNLSIINVGKELLNTSKLSKFVSGNNLGSVLFIADSKEFSLLFRSSKNLKNVKSLDISAVNALDLLKYDNVFIEEKAFEEKILKVLK